MFFVAMRLMFASTGHARPVNGGTPGSGTLSISTMPEHGTNGAAPDAARPEPDHLVIRPRRGLPGSRSVVGGLMVAVAALLTWWAAVGEGDPPRPRYLVAARPIGPGERITEHHLAYAALDLGPDLRRSAFTSPESLVDASTAGPIGQGELIQAGAVLTGEDPTPERELAFPVSATWAGGGHLEAGDRIDVYATYGDGTSSRTRRVLTDVRIRRIETSTGDRLGDSGTQTITVGLRGDIGVAMVVNAVQSANITVTRVTGEPGRANEGDGHDRYDAGAGLRPDSDTDDDTPAGQEP